MELRLATKDDFEIFAPIKQEFNLDYGISEKSKEFILKEFEDYLSKGVVILALIDNKIIGYISGIIEGDIYEKFGYISEVFIKKPYRGKGISTRLKNKFLEFLKDKGINICRIEVNLSNPAQEAYKKWGFKIDKYRMTLKF